MELRPDTRGWAVLYDRGQVSTGGAEKLIENAFLRHGTSAPRMYAFRETTPMIDLPRDITRVLMMGRTMNRERYLRSDVDIRSYRGSWSQMYEADVLSTYAPGELWYGNELGKRPFIIWDVGRFITGPETAPEDFHLDPAPLMLPTLIARLKALPFMSIDIESTDANPEAQPTMIGFGDGKGFAVVFRGRNLTAQVRGVIQHLLDSPEQVFVWQNGMFDVGYLTRAGYRVRPLRHEDTMVAFATAWPSLDAKGLDTLTTLYTPRSYYKDDVRYTGAESGPELQKGLRYNAIDVDVTGCAWPQIVDDLDHLNAAPGYQTSMSIFETLNRGNNLGLRLDDKEVARLRNHHATEQDRHQRILDAQVGRHLNVNSNPQVKTWLYEELGIKKFLPSGPPNGKKETILEAVTKMPEAHPSRFLLETFLKVRYHRKRQNTYLHPHLKDVDGRVRTSWNLAGIMKTGGRLSARKAWDTRRASKGPKATCGVGLQVVPLDVRSPYIPDEGHVYVGMDLAQAEARVVAALSNDLDLLKAMNDGKDVHCLLASQIPQFGMDYQTLVDNKKVAGHPAMRAREVSKTLNHSKNYGGSWHTIRQTIIKRFLDTGISMTVAEARQFEKLVRMLHPNLMDWWNAVKHEAAAGPLVNPFGRVRDYRHLGKITGEVHRTAISFVPQSTIADLTTTIIARLDKLFEFGKRGQIQVHTHDGLLAQVKIDDLEWAEEQIKIAGNVPFEVNGIELLIPLDIKHGYNWAELD